MIRIRATVSFFSTVLLAGAALAAAPGLAPVPSAPSGKLAQEIQVALDAKTDPCANFYQYACGGWLSRTKLPGDEPYWGRSFSEIEERNLAALRATLEAAVKAPGNDPERVKLGLFYASCMDEAGIEKLGGNPVKPLLSELDKVQDMPSLMEAVGRLHRQGFGGLFSIDVDADFKDPALNILHVGQGGLGLPDRDYYFKEDPKGVETRKQYGTFITNMLVLGGEKPEAAAPSAKAILAFETELARMSRPRAEMRDPVKLYNRVERVGLKKMAPDLPWDGYFKALGVPEVTQINVMVPEFFEGLNKKVPTTDPAVLRAYLKLRALSGSAEYLSKPFLVERFKFRQALTGQAEDQPRWKRCVYAAQGAMGEGLGKAFVEKYFPGRSKAIAKELIQRVENAFAAGMPKLPWMDEVTRQRAVGKMGKISNKIGFPEKWRDYGKLEVKAGDYFGNALRGDSFERARTLAKIGNKVDKTEWAFPAQIVNAFYNPLNNEMTFPAGILQPPFFKHDYPMAMNFGGIGMVMGHELTHGFDDSGRMFDADGKMVEWWAPEVSGKFDQAAQCINDMYSGFEAQPGLKVNGKLTLGENIADFGGIKSAYYAFKQWAKENPASQPSVAGLTEDQLFFLGFAQTWCSLSAPEFDRMLILSDPHSLPVFRVNGPLSHFPPFWEAFSCQQGAPMHPEKTCAVW